MKMIMGTCFQMILIIKNLIYKKLIQKVTLLFLRQDVSISELYSNNQGGIQMDFFLKSKSKSQNLLEINNAN